MLPADFYLLRGLAREFAHWGDFAEDLKKQKFCHDVKALELPGAGRFHKLTSPLAIGEMAEFVITQVEESKERPKILLSMSLGAMVCCEVVLKRPELFDKVFLINTSFANLSPIYHRLQLKALQSLYHIVRSKDLYNRELEVLKMVSRNKEKWSQVAEEWTEISRQRPMSSLNVLRQLAAAARYRLPKANPQNSEIVVLRSLGDQMVHPDCSKKFADHWQLPLETHPDAGHDLALDAPEWVLKTINKHLKD